MIIYTHAWISYKIPMPLFTFALTLKPNDLVHNLHVFPVNCRLIKSYTNSQTEFNVYLFLKTPIWLFQVELDFCNFVHVVLNQDNTYRFSRR